MTGMFRVFGGTTTGPDAGTDDGPGTDTGSGTDAGVAAAAAAAADDDGTVLQSHDDDAASSTDCGCGNNTCGMLDGAAGIPSDVLEIPLASVEVQPT